MGLLFIDVSASRRKLSSGLTSGAGRQYVKACPTTSHVWDKLLHTDDRHRKSVLMKASEFRREAETSINSRSMFPGCFRVI